MTLVLKLVPIALFAVAGSSALLAQSNPLVGTWKLNVAKSKFDPGPGPKSLTRTVVAQDDGMTYSFEGAAADGKPVAYGFAVKFDGKDNPISGSMPSGADTISAQRIDFNTYEATLKKAGNVIGTSKVTVAKDGRARPLIRTVRTQRA